MGNVTATASVTRLHRNPRGESEALPFMRASLVAAVLFGLTIAACFASMAAWPLPFLGLVAFYWAVDRAESPRQAVAIGFAAGMAAMIGCFYWLNFTIMVHGGIHPVASVAMFLLYCVVFGTKFMVMAALMFGLKRHARVTPLVTWPLAVMAAEVAQLTLFPWFIGSLQVRNLYFIQIADLIGAPGLTFAVALVASLLYGALRRDRRAAIALLATLAVIYGYGFLRLRQIESLEAAAPPLRVALVQPNTPLRWSRFDPPDRGAAVIATCSRLTLEAARAAGGPLDLVVWPEGGTPFSFSSSSGQLDEYFRATVSGLARSLNTNMIFYDLLWDGNRPFNNVWLVGRDAAPRGSYQKIMLLAFGEYIPGADLIPSLEGFGNVTQHRRGTTIRTLPADNAVLAPQICYEILSPGFTRRFVAMGGQYIINVTNDAWFGNTTASNAHLLQACIRAIENRRPLVRDTNSGTSTMVSAGGRFLTPLTPQFVQTFLTAEIHSPAVNTFYTRFGDIFGWLGVLCVVGLLLPALRRR